MGLGGLLPSILVASLSLSGCLFGFDESYRGDENVTIERGSFVPEYLTVRVGDKVTWYNNDTQPHRLVWENTTISPGSVEPGESWACTFNETGAFVYYCPDSAELSGGRWVGMRGQVVVRGWEGGEL